MKRAIAFALAAFGLASGTAADSFQVDCGCSPVTVHSDGTSVSLSHDGDNGDCTPRLVSGGEGPCIVNGDFAALFDGWSVAKEIGSNGDFGFRSSGTTNGGLTNVDGDPRHPFPISEQSGPGSYALHQSFVVPAGGTTVTFDYFINTGASKTTAATMAATGGDPNQRARVDLLPAGFTDFFGPTSLTGVLHNLFDPDNASNGGASSTGLWQTVTLPIPASLAGQEVILAFRQADNLGFYNLAVDNVQLGSCPSGLKAAPTTATRRVRSMGAGDDEVVVHADDEEYGPPIVDADLY